MLAEQVVVVAYPMRLSASAGQPTQRSETDDTFSRQSFLGPRSQERMATVRAGIAGLGGGGSHVDQQLAHLGWGRYRLFDGDVVEVSNLNRLVNGTREDAQVGTPKVEVGERIIRRLSVSAEILTHEGRWQDRPELLRGCDIVFGCVDSFAERRELEVVCRRYLIPYIDIGMDVHQVEGEPPRLAGQVILSMPGSPCMFCLGFLNEERLAREAEQYGAAGPRPQVVWPNGILASTAVGIAVDLVTGWTRRQDQVIYLSYDGNTGLLTPHVRLPCLPAGPCPHYSLEDVGEPVFRPIAK
jgi:hypothetical protein